MSYITLQLKFKTSVEMLMGFGMDTVNKEEIPPAICFRHIKNTQLHCPGIDRNADDWVVVWISALYGARATAYVVKAGLRM